MESIFSEAGAMNKRTVVNASLSARELSAHSSIRTIPAMAGGVLTIVYSFASERTAKALAEALRHAVRDEHSRGVCPYGSSGTIRLDHFHPEGRFDEEVVAADGSLATTVVNPFALQSLG